MSANKIARVPVASHGLHKHDYNYPWLSSINFGDVMPCYYNTLRKGEKDIPKAGLYSQLMPIAHNAFATGRFNFKAVFVPYKLVWKPWYCFDQQTYYNSDAKHFVPNMYPFITQGVLSTAFASRYGTAGTLQKHDILVVNDSIVQGDFYRLNDIGRRVLRILSALGCSPTFVKSDTNTLNILPIMCYIKAYSDYYFPNNYIWNYQWQSLNQWFDREEVDYNHEIEGLFDALEICSQNFYENSMFDIAWDNPVTPNASFGQHDITIPDVSGTNSYVDTDNNRNVPPIVVAPENVFSQYALNALKSLSMWMKRRQLSGVRLIDKFLVSRGITLSDDSSRNSYLVGQRNVEIEVSGVENNTDVNLGELAGRGVASSGNSPLSFECQPDDDGILLVIVSPVPDANYPIFVDGFCARKDFLDNYNAEFDKLGTAPIPSRCMQQSYNGETNLAHDPSFDGVFGFLNRYWDEVQERPRLLGDFVLPSRGAEELQAYHTFRIFSHPFQMTHLFHSYDFQRMSDARQYQRLFYSDEQENLMLFLRWYGSQYKEKLPLGDSYEWDDDEMNKKVSVVIGGSQK